MCNHLAIKHGNFQKYKYLKNGYFFFLLLNLTQYFSVLRNFKLMLIKKAILFYIYGLSKISSSDLLRNNIYTSHKKVNRHIKFHLD